MRTITSCISHQKTVYNSNEYLDIRGNIVDRNPVEYPYSYDPYVLYKCETYKETDTSYYSDRVQQWSKQEFNNALSQMGLKPYGAPYERMSWKNPEQVGQLMSILLKSKVECTAIMEGANYYNGYPYWIVYVR